MAGPRRQPLRPRATPARARGAFLLGLLVGLFAGLAIALAVALYLTKTPIPFIGRSKPAAKEEGTKPPAIAGMPQGDVKGERPKFDFYRILPGAEESVSDRELKEAARAARAQDPARAEAARSIYFIQAGSFQNPADADNQKAKLALLGLEAGVEPTTLPDRGTWYRVRLGPYSRIEELNRVRQTLAQNGIDASLVKIKDPATKDSQ
jgi:cell division protein FtsN